MGRTYDGVDLERLTGFLEDFKTLQDKWGVTATLEKLITRAMNNHKAVTRRGMAGVRIPIDTDVVREKAEELGMSLSDISKATGMSPSALNGWLRVSDPNEPNFLKLAEVLKLKPQELVGKTYKGTTDGKRGKRYTGKYSRKK